MLGLAIADKPADTTSPARQGSCAVTQPNPASPPDAIISVLLLKEDTPPLALRRGGPGPEPQPGPSASWLTATDSGYSGRMSWTAHYFDRRLNRNAITRSCATKEDAIRLACDLMLRQCRVDFVMGPEHERVQAAEITKWCKAHPSSDRRPSLK